VTDRINIAELRANRDHDVAAHFKTTLVDIGALDALLDMCEAGHAFIAAPNVRDLDKARPRLKDADARFDFDQESNEAAAPIETGSATTSQREGA
jgi:hypothetical protein